jgi:predicted RNA binding protein YcfA (HicA-like mRNA interferase family)
MSSYPSHVWNQLKNITPDDLIKALKKDGWIQDVSIGAVLVFRKSSTQRITIHYHPKKTYGHGLLKSILDDIGWDEKQMRALKLIK